MNIDKEKLKRFKNCLSVLSLKDIARIKQLADDMETRKSGCIVGSIFVDEVKGTDFLNKYPILIEPARPTLQQQRENREIALGFLENIEVVEWWRIDDKVKDDSRTHTIEYTLNEPMFNKFKPIIDKVYRESCSEKLRNGREPYLPGATKWEEIKIQFLDTEKCKIWSRKNKNKIYKIITYKDNEMRGVFESKKGNHNPNAQWKFLLAVAFMKGRIPTKDRTKKKRLSDALKSYFKLPGNPFFSCKHDGYYNLKIELIPPESMGEIDRQIKKEREEKGVNTKDTEEINEIFKTLNDIDHKERRYNDDSFYQEKE